MTRTGIPLAALLLVACTEAVPRVPSAVVVVSPPIAASSASSASEAAPGEPVASPEPKAVALPDVTACVLTTTQWRGATPKSELRVRADGPVFATVRSGKGSLHLPVGKAADGAILEIADKALAARGHLAASALWLHPGKPFVLGDAVIPLGASRLDWTGGKPGAVGVAFDPQEGIALAHPPLAADVPCDAISLDDTTIDEMAALPGVAKTGKEGLLRVVSCFALLDPMIPGTCRTKQDTTEAQKHSPHVPLSSQNLDWLLQQQGMSGTAPGSSLMLVSASAWLVRLGRKQHENGSWQPQSWKSPGAHSPQMPLPLHTTPPGAAEQGVPAPAGGFDGVPPEQMSAVH